MRFNPSFEIHGALAKMVRHLALAIVSILPLRFRLILCRGLDQQCLSFNPSFEIRGALGGRRSVPGNPFRFNPSFEIRIGSTDRKASAKTHSVSILPLRFVQRGQDVSIYR